MKISEKNLGVLILLLSPFSILFAQQSPQDRAAIVEIEDDAFVASPRNLMPKTDAYTVDAVDYFTRQVNIDSNGDNMVGDAANEPSIAVDPTNPDRMIIGWRQFDDISSNFRQAGYGYSSNGGLSWTFPGVIDPGIFRSDPVLDFDTDGTFYYNSLQSGFACDVFTIPATSYIVGDAVPARGGDKQWVHVDKTASEGSGHYYSYWNTSFTTCEPGAFTRSTDNAQSFEPCVAIDDEPFWGTLATATDGTLYITGRNDFGEIVMLSSTNAKDDSETVSWDTIKEVDLDGQISFFEPINPQGLSGQAWVSVDISNGPGQDNIYVLASVERNSIFDPADVMFAKSTDGGANFETPIRINTDVGTDAYQWFGTMSVAPNGRIDVVWLDTRDAPSGTNNSVLYYSFSEDQGDTWSENTAISESFDPNIGYPQQNKMGDYFDMVSDNEHAHLAWAATFSGGQDVYYTRIAPDGVLGNEQFAISKNFISVYPNPIDNTSVIDIRVSTNETVKLTLFDLMGKTIPLPFNTEISSSQKILLSGEKGLTLSSGVYFLSATIGNTTQTHQISVK